MIFYSLRRNFTSTKFHCTSCFTVHVWVLFSGVYNYAHCMILFSILYHFQVNQHEQHIHHYDQNYNILTDKLDRNVRFHTVFSDWPISAVENFMSSRLAVFPFSGLLLILFDLWTISIKCSTMIMDWWYVLLVIVFCTPLAKCQPCCWHSSISWDYDFSALR